MESSYYFVCVLIDLDIFKGLTIWMCEHILASMSTPNIFSDLQLFSIDCTLLYCSNFHIFYQSFKNIYLTFFVTTVRFHTN